MAAHRCRRLEQIHIDEAFETRLAHGAVKYISLYKAICAKDCLLWSGKNEPLQFDSNHFTKGGSIKVAEMIGPRMFRTGTAGVDPVAAGMSRPDL
jgi:hypothetical protein